MTTRTSRITLVTPRRTYLHCVEDPNQGLYPNGGWWGYAQRRHRQCSSSLPPLYPAPSRLARGCFSPSSGRFAPRSPGAAPPPSVVAPDRHRHVEADRDPCRGHYISVTVGKRLLLP